MKSDKELFNLAKNYAMMEDELNKDLYEYDKEVVRDLMMDIRNVLLDKKYSVDKFMYYKNLYKEMSIKEYFEFIKILE